MKRFHFQKLLVVLVIFLSITTLTTWTATAQGADISGQVWEDANTNGIIDNGETGISGVTIVLYDVAENSCQSTQTDANGHYTFTGLTNGAMYQVYEAALETTPQPAFCPPTENTFAPNQTTIIPGSIQDPSDYASSTPNVSGNLTASSTYDFGDFKAPPFRTCPSTAFRSQVVDDKHFGLYGINVSTGDYLTLVNDWTTFTNAIGFNILSDYIFGYDISKKDGSINLIDGNYHIYSLPVQVPDVNYTLFVGDVSMDGKLYLNDGDAGPNIYVIDVNPQRHTYLQLIDTIPLIKSSNPPNPTKTYLADWAFNPIDGMLYGIRHKRPSLRHLIRVNPTTGLVEDLGATTIPLNSPGNYFGAVFFDENGNFYANQNRSGKIYKIDLSSPPSTTPIQAVDVFTGPVSKRNDGARCLCAPLATFDFGDAPDTNGQTSGANKAYHIIISNTKSPYLGATPPDNDINGFPGLNADGDNKNDIDDEDGLVGFDNVDDDWSNGGAINVNVRNVGAEGACLHAWVDWDNDGFGVGKDSAAHVDITSDGDNNISFAADANMPAAGTFPSTAYLRLRLTPGRCTTLSPTGPAFDGEIEDYILGFTPNAVTSNKLNVSAAGENWLLIAFFVGLSLLTGAITVSLRNNLGSGYF